MGFRKKDKNFTLTSKLYNSENPLFLGEYHQAFKNSSWITDFGFTEGYKKTTAKKKSGDKSHFFSKFTKNFNLKDTSNNSLDISIQHTSDNKYFKLYDIKSNLVNKKYRYIRKFDKLYSRRRRYIFWS